MREKNLKILSWIYLGGALLSLIIWVWNVVIGGLLAPAVDITRGIGLAAVLTLSELALCILMALVGWKMRQKFTKKTFQMGLALIACSLFSLLLALFGAYNVIPSLLGLALPAVTLFFIR